MSDTRQKNQEKNALKTIRADIDNLDEMLLATLEKRVAIAAKVTASKADTPRFRPGREADIIRGLWRKSSLEPTLIEAIWRQITAANLARQQPTVVAVIEKNPALMSTARWRFGSSARYICCPDSQSAIESISSGNADLAVLPHWSDAAWQSPPSNVQGKIWLTSVAPLASTEGLLPVAIFAPDQPDASMSDVTLIDDNGALIEKLGYHPDDAGVIGIFQPPDFPV